MRLSTLAALAAFILTASPALAQQGATGTSPVFTTTSSSARGGGGPVNDRFDQGIPIVVGQTTYTGTNAGATVESDESNPTASCQPDDGGNSVYWAFRAASTSTVTIDLSGSSFDTVVTLLDGFNFEEIGCDDDGGDGTRSLLSAQVSDDFVYLIRVTGYLGAEGDINMELSGIDGVLSQTASDPGDIYTLPLTAFGSYVESTVGATNDVGETATSCQSNDDGKSIWRRFTAPSTGVVTFDLRGSSFDTVIGVYTYPGLGTLPTNELGCDDDGLPGDGDLTSILSLDVQADQEYAIRISGFSDREGDVQLTITDGPFVAQEETPSGTVALTVAPNPVASSARVALDLPTAEYVRVELYDVTGRRVAVMHDGDAAAGRLNLSLDASSLPSGVYVVRAVGETVRLTERVTVVR